jgi:hypothetical protein
LDEDGDGVADYLDLCPKSPAEARGMVDKNGCPLDSDDDGVYDYLDLCNNTALAARGFIDKNGCPLDSDDDGGACEQGWLHCQATDRDAFVPAHCELPSAG